MPNTPNSVVTLDQFGRYPPLGGFSGPVPMIGVTDGSNAAVGNVGEFMQAILLATAGGTVLSSTSKSIVSITLTPGDWDVWGAGGIGPTAGQTDVVAIFSISSVANTAGPQETTRAQLNAAAGASLGTTILAPPIVRASLTVSTAFSIVVDAVWTGGATTMPVFGSISARRVR
jgi:hypothetical protein